MEITQGTAGRALLLAFALLLAVLPQLLVAQPEGPTLDGLSGGQFVESELEQGVTILVVWASWSPRCRDIVPRLNNLARDWGDQARILSVVFQESPAEVRRFLVDQELEVPVFIDADGSFSKKHAVTTLPGLLVIDNGRHQFRGRLPADPDPTIRGVLE